MQQHLEITLHGEFNAKEFERAWVYTLFSTDISEPFKVKKGFHGLWPVKCPKCQKYAGMHMVTDGLVNLSEASKRQAFMETELSQSCPQHESQWMLTMLHVLLKKNSDQE